MRLLTIDDVAGLLKISKSTLYRWVNKREIPFVKLGGKLRFNEDEIKPSFCKIPSMYPIETGLQTASNTIN